MRKLLFIFILLFSSTVLAESYQLTCVDNESFITNFLIDKDNRTIFHSTSYDPGTKKKYLVNKYEKIIEWKSHSHILHYSNSDSDGMPNIFLTNLKEMKQYLAGFYADELPFTSEWSCFNS
tara:strand:- start:95 stop:457 length:363 start_codon:yes stop_codon:yes gene_type:complete